MLSKISLRAIIFFLTVSLVVVPVITPSPASSASLGTLETGYSTAAFFGENAIVPNLLWQRFCQLSEMPQVKHGITQTLEGWNGAATLETASWEQISRAVIANGQTLHDLDDAAVRRLIPHIRNSKMIGLDWPEENDPPPQSRYKVYELVYENYKIVIRPQAGAPSGLLEKYLRRYLDEFDRGEMAAEYSIGRTIGDGKVMYVLKKSGRFVIKEFDQAGMLVGLCIPIPFTLPFGLGVGQILDSVPHAMMQEWLELQRQRDPDTAFWADVRKDILVNKKTVILDEPAVSRLIPFIKSSKLLGLRWQPQPGRRYEVSYQDFQIRIRPHSDNPPTQPRIAGAA